MITSRHNPHVKQILRLYKKKERDVTGLFLIEGEREAERWGEIDTLYYTDENEFVARASKNAQALQLSPELFQEIAYRDRGVLAIARQKQVDLQKKLSLVLVVEGIEKPGNLGAMMRSADAVGADAILVCDEVVDVYHPNVVRASMGTLGSVPFMRMTSLEAIALCEKNSLAVFTATPEAQTNYFEADLTEAVALVFGSEKDGLSACWKGAAKKQLRIPMCGINDSLNVAAATTVLLYEALRQRSL